MKTEYQEREGGEGFSVFDEEENRIFKLATLAKFSNHTKKTSTKIPNPRTIYIEHVSGLWNGKPLTETRPSSLLKSLG